MDVTAAILASAAVLVALLAWDAWRRWLVVYRERTAHVDAYEKAVERLTVKLDRVIGEKNAAALGSVRR